MGSAFIFVRDQKGLQPKQHLPSPSSQQLGLLALGLPPEQGLFGKQTDHNQSREVTNYPKLFSLQHSEAQHDSKQVHDNTEQSKQPDSLSPNE